MKFCLPCCFGLLASLLLVSIKSLGWIGAPLWVLLIPALFFPIAVSVVLLIVIIVDKLFTRAEW